jgi:hypothetical protein
MPLTNVVNQEPTPASAAQAVTPTPAPIIATITPPQGQKKLEKNGLTIIWEDKNNDGKLDLAERESAKIYATSATGSPISIALFSLIDRNMDASATTDDSADTITEDELAKAADVIKQYGAALESKGMPAEGALNAYANASSFRNVPVSTLSDSRAEILTGISGITKETVDQKLSGYHADILKAVRAYYTAHTDATADDIAGYLLRLAMASLTGLYEPFGVNEADLKNLERYSPDKVTEDNLLGWLKTGAVSGMEGGRSTASAQSISTLYTELIRARDDGKYEQVVEIVDKLIPMLQQKPSETGLAIPSTGAKITWKDAYSSIISILMDKKELLLASVSADKLITLITLLEGSLSGAGSLEDISTPQLIEQRKSLIQLIIDFKKQAGGSEADRKSFVEAAVRPIIASLTAKKLYNGTLTLDSVRLIAKTVASLADLLASAGADTSSLANIYATQITAANLESLSSDKGTKALVAFEIARSKVMLATSGNGTEVPFQISTTLKITEELAILAANLETPFAEGKFVVGESGLKFTKLLSIATAINTLPQAILPLIKDAKKEGYATIYLLKEIVGKDKKQTKTATGLNKVLADWQKTTSPAPGTRPDGNNSRRPASGDAPGANPPGNAGNVAAAESIVAVFAEGDAALKGN